jgi:hypothetical protein
MSGRASALKLEVDDSIADETGRRDRRIATGERRDRGLVGQQGAIMTARVGVITFPGTLDDVDAARAVRLPAPRR